MKVLIYLSCREGVHKDRPWPDVFLLDLDLPCMIGGELLAAIKQEERSKNFSVIVLMTWQAESDIVASHASHAAAFIGKPVDLDQFVTVVRSIEPFWFNTGRLPLHPHEV